MTTPAFVPQSSSTLTPVRYLTALDPYHYTVDNRPLSDLATNLAELGTQGIDAGRRAGLISALAANLALENLFHMEDANQFHGLVPSFSGGVLTIGRGAMATVTAPYVGSTSLAMRQGILITPVALNVSAAATAGQSIDYLVQCKINDLTTGVASPNPYFDTTSTYIPSSTTVGDLQISLKTGAPATTGSQTTPSPDGGFVSLYKVTFTNGAASPVVETTSSGTSPVRRLSYLVTYADNASGSAASSAALNGMNVPRFLNGATSSISFAVPVKSLDLCPTAPLRLRLTLSSTASGGNARLQLDSLALGTGSAVAVAPTTVTEVFALGGTANTALTVTSSASFAAASLKVPPSAFAGFMGGMWKINKDVIVFQLSRLGGDVLDTSLGDLDLLNLEIIQ